MKQANAKQVKFMLDIADFINDFGLGGLYGQEYEGNFNFQLHHVLGRSAKHNKISIGHEFIIPVPFELHDVSSNHPENVTHFKKAFVKKHGDQRGIFQILVSSMEHWGYDVPSLEVYNAIMDTNA